MRWASYRSATDGLAHTALLTDGSLHALPTDVQLLDLLGDGGEALALAAEQAFSAPFEVVTADSANLLAPIPRPPSVRDFMAFENHYVATRKGLGLAVEAVFYEQPCFYFSNPAAVIGPNEAVPIAPGTAQFDYELEVAAVIGRAGRDLSPEVADDHIAGYTILCDWSARDLQAKETVFGTGPAKGKDTATSVGPYLVTPEELDAFKVERGFDLAMTATVNGEPYSAGNWSSIYWTMAEMLAFASRGTELRPGDIVGTGTVGTGSIMELGAVHGHDRYPWLALGDEVHLNVAELGEIRGRVVAGTTPIPLR